MQYKSVTLILVLGLVTLLRSTLLIVVRGYPYSIQFAQTHPYSAYIAFTYGVFHK